MKVRKTFFFEKNNPSAGKGKKRLVDLVRWRVAAAGLGTKSFLRLFFKKEVLSCCFYDSFQCDAETKWICGYAVAGNQAGGAGCQYGGASGAAAGQAVDGGAGSAGGS
jgi:hypothetical protein